MKAILRPTSLVHDLEIKLVVFELTSSELFQIEGDAAEVIRFLHSKWQKPLAVKEIKSHLLKKSTRFSESTTQDETLNEALCYFRDIGLIDYESKF